MIAITTYTEPIPVDVTVNEPPFIRDRDENEERIESGGQNSFAQLLAGLLNSSQDVDFSGNANEGSNAQQGENTHNLSAADLYAGKQDAFSDALKKSADNDIDIDLSDAAIEKEYQNIQSADFLFSSSLNEANPAEGMIELSDNIDADTLNLLAELASKIDLSSGDFKSKDFASIAEKIIKEPVSEIAQQTLASETNAKQQIKENADPLSDSKNKPVKGDQDLFTKNENAPELSLKNKTSEDNVSLFGKRENDNSRLDRMDEFRKGQRKDKISVEVRDLRTAAGGNTQTASALAETAAGRAAQQSSGGGEITLDLRLPENANTAQTQSWDFKSGNALENMLARELHQNFNGDIVRHASVALRDGGAGTIKIALHPETLGNVKIHLELTDNKITGRIIVESADAMNAFRKEMSALEQAFRDSGFADASLDLSLTADGGKNQEQDESIFSSQYASRNAASNYEDSYEQETSPVIDVFFGKREASINLLA